MRRLPGGSAKLTDVSQSTGNRLPRPDHLRILHFLPPRTRHPPFPFAPAFRHSACTAFHVFFMLYPLFTGEVRTPLTAAKERSYTANQFTAGIRMEPPRSEGADYKFKCKPARSRGTKVRNAPSQVPRPRMMRREFTKTTRVSKHHDASDNSDRNRIIAITRENLERKTIIYNLLRFPPSSIWNLNKS